MSGRGGTNLALIPTPCDVEGDALPLSAMDPLTSSYNDKIRPLLDAVDKLRNLMVMKEGIQLPTIVVVGDQSSGKSSVLESLAGISLPRGQGICTRVPLIMRLQNHPCDEPQLYLEFEGKVVHSDEENIAVAIAVATNEIAGGGKGISNTPLTLVVKKDGVPDLTMVDLPGITRVPVHGQPENIYEQVSGMIMEYIRPEETIILNVLSATVDFSTCESIRMSQMVDKKAERTLAVVTKCDKNPEGLLEKVTADDVNIGLGYVCVRNRIGEETYDEARVEEHRLFKTHPLLSKIDESMVGIPVLARRLMQIQATIVARCLPDIVNKISEKLNANVALLQSMPKNLSSIAEAVTAFMQIMGSAKDSLRKILLRGEFDEYPDEKGMHCTARLAEMLDRYSEKLQNCPNSNFATDFLLDELEVLEEIKGIGLPNFLPRVAFLTCLQRKIGRISSAPVEFVSNVWEYIGGVVLKVLMQYSELYPQLQNTTRQAAQSLMAKVKERAIGHVVEIVQMEKCTDFTCNPEYMAEWNKLMEKQVVFLQHIDDPSEPSKFVLEGIGEVDVEKLRERRHLVQQAFDLRMRMVAYWKTVLRRLVDSVALHLLFTVQGLVNKELEDEVVSQVVGPQGGGLQRMLEETPAVAAKREKLMRSISLLKESREVVAQIIDRVSMADMEKHQPAQGVKGGGGSNHGQGLHGGHGEASACSRSQGRWWLKSWTGSPRQTWRTSFSPVRFYVFLFLCCPLVCLVLCFRLW
ncbi:hypothetical protein MLD38_035820 [Melastoma candidum]|uniref:Uncharacterized protein n=1 Tax=Melastoma candidum TaxID=119954 RepID=A0ACB9LI20_9MYRT|nr:hypothetical protein MLD38_035820 [Melastoma candidum]